MKLGNGSEIKFDGTVNGTETLFLLVVDGEPTVHVVCDTADPDKTIKIRRWGQPHTTLATKGRFKMAVKFTEDSHGMPLGAEERVDAKSVYAYILPRALTMMARLLRAS